MTTPHEVTATIDEIARTSPLRLFVKKTYSDFQEFMFKNNVIVAATGWSIGVATKEVIEAFLTQVILPMFTAMVHLLRVHKALRLPVGSMAIVNLIYIVFKWLLIIGCTFFLLEYVLNRRIIGLTSSVSKKDRKDFVESKEATKTPLVPMSKEQATEIKSEMIKKTIEEKEAAVDAFHEQFAMPWLT